VLHEFSPNKNSQPGGGNNLRLIAFIEFRDNRMYVKHIVSHAEYDKLCKIYAKAGD